EKRQIWTTVVYTALFSLVFILVSIPFSNNAWFALGASQAFFYTLAFVLIAAAVVILSRLMLSRCHGLKHFTLLFYIMWVIAEVLVVSLLYTFFTYQGVELGIISPYLRSTAAVFISALVYTAVCLCVPYFFSALHFALQDKDNTIRLMNYGNVVSDRPAVPYNDNRITLFDNNGVLKFSISSDNLYFIESDDNYIKVWYMDSSGEMKQYMLRCRLKTVEDSFADSELVRCHRKYIVNIRKISILKSEKEGYKIDFDIDSIEPIPISKTYEQAVLARFNSR
ncbi:MAG: LytTR family transcriptional regulator DNA-binding domain-containing protein, partial [Bacteroidales bacterium]|nr:LytTR family transcriptional regulator DNA-binding domain-containing protein [Bacteroidales bacterium]